VPVAQHRFEIAALEAGARLDQFLVTRLADLSRARIQALIKVGAITLNAAVVKPGAKLHTGDSIGVTIPEAVPVETLAQEIPLSVLFEDDDLIVLDKPAGLVVHPAAGHADGTLVNALLHHCTALSGIGGEMRPGIVHRLDKDTSGCLVAAKNDLTHRALVRQFAGREVAKIYLALVAGTPAAVGGIIDQPIGRHPVHRKKMAVVERGRPACTDWRVLGSVPGGSLVECTLHSGRTHQIRVHLKHLGHPLLGDEVYGRRGDHPRQMLHAWRLGFVHPRTAARVNFISPIPADFVEAGCPPNLP
jgi:23S rRNA pseudouridine1911/1915/1917 synthase